MDFILNVGYNKLWAHGNFFLILNHLYLIYQSVLSIPLMFEAQFLLKYVRPLRVMGLFSAMVYNFLYLGLSSDFFYLFKAEDKRNFDGPAGFGDMVYGLFLAYSLLDCLPNLMINFVIIIKEIELLVVQYILNKKAPSEDDRLQLSLIDVEYLFLRYLNPAWLLKKSFEKVEGYDPLDMVIENKNDEEHYYAGKIINKIKS